MLFVSCNPSLTSFYSDNPYPKVFFQYNHLPINIKHTSLNKKIIKIFFFLPTYLPYPFGPLQETINFSSRPNRENSPVNLLKIVPWDFLQLRRDRTRAPPLSCARSGRRSVSTRGTPEWRRRPWAGGGRGWGPWRWPPPRARCGGAAPARAGSMASLCSTERSPGRGHPNWQAQTKRNDQWKP